MPPLKPHELIIITTNINFTNVEFILDYENSTTNKVMGVLTILVILLVNISLLRYIFNHGFNIFMNQLIAIDCCLCICNIGVVLPILEPETCPVRFFLFFVNTVNRLLTVTIGFYRYVFVVRTTWVHTKQQRQALAGLIMLMVALLSGSLTSLCIFYSVRFFPYMGMYFNCHNPELNILDWYKY